MFTVNFYRSFRHEISLPLFLIIILMLMVCAGCSDNASSQESNPAYPCSDPGRAARVEGALSRIETVLEVNSDGTVSINENASGYPALTEGDRALGGVLIDVLNAMVSDGVIQVNADLSVVWLSSTSSSCSAHWWGETCDVSSGTTKDICVGLEAGEGALLICDLIPVLSTACSIIEVVGAIPLEAEICPCSEKGEGSEFHVTWVDIAWFTCE